MKWSKINPEKLPLGEMLVMTTDKILILCEISNTRNLGICCIDEKGSVWRPEYYIDPLKIEYEI